MLILPALAVGGYAAIKGEVSEKLSLRWAARLGPQTILKRSVPQQVPRGLDDPRWDFSPKEEADAGGHPRDAASRHANPRPMVGGDGLVLRRHDRLGLGAAEGDLRQISPARAVTDVRASRARLLGLFARRLHAGPAAAQHVARAISPGRHILPLVVASMPWAAGGTYICCRADRRTAAAGPPRVSSAAQFSADGVLPDLRRCDAVEPRHHLTHLSRWGHWAAGRWLAAHAGPGEEVLDTRGWARFVSGLPGYDYWHVRQALTDSHLSYILVGLDELKASERAGGDAAVAPGLRRRRPLAEFPASPSDPTPAVRIYRFRRPASWEGIAR